MTVLALPTTDWLQHRLTVSGPAAAVSDFRDAAAGAGAIPWYYDLDRMQEDWFHRMLAPDPKEREISLEGARLLAETYRGLVGEQHERVVARVGQSRACPLDLYQLIPAPEPILRRGPDDPASLCWLWENWGTTLPLRDVRVLADAPDRRLRRSGRVTYRFLSADWTPWRAIRAMRLRWPALLFDVQPQYGVEPPEPGTPGKPTGQQASRASMRAGSRAKRRRKRRPRGGARRARAAP
jgi:hypothetical protein